MTAEVVPQRVALMNVRSWEEFRAVCHDTDVHGPGEYAIPTWMAPETHKMWIDAKMDAVAHNAIYHPRPSHVRSWQEIIGRPTRRELSDDRRTRAHVSG